MTQALAVRAGLATATLVLVAGCTTSHRRDLGDVPLSGGVSRHRAGSVSWIMPS